MENNLENVSLKNVLYHKSLVEKLQQLFMAKIEGKFNVKNSFQHDVVQRTTD